MLKTEEEITIEKVDFEWVSSQKKPKNLRYAQKLLREDGNIEIFKKTY